MAERRKRLQAQKQALEKQLEDAVLDDVDDEGDDQSQRCADLREQIDFVKSELAELGGGDARSDGVRRGVLTRIGLGTDTTSTSTTTTMDAVLVYALNAAAACRRRREALRRRVDALEAELASAHSENEANASRIDMMAMESELRVQQHEDDKQRRSVEALLAQSYAPDAAAERIRALETELNAVKRQQMQLMSPMSAATTRRTQRRRRPSPASPPAPASCSSASSSAARSGQAALGSALATRRRQRSARKKPSDNDARHVLARLTDKSLFTGTSRFQRPRQADEHDADDDHDEHEHDENVPHKPPPQSRSRHRKQMPQPMQAAADENRGERHDSEQVEKLKKRDEGDEPHECEKHENTSCAAPNKADAAKTWDAFRAVFSQAALKGLGQKSAEP